MIASPNMHWPPYMLTARRWGHSQAAFLRTIG
jgi:hypothetical protein